MSKVKVNLGIVKPGWAYLHAGEAEPNVLPLVLDRALNDWLRDNPAIKVRAALPIQHNGHTVAIHVWYD